MGLVDSLVLKVKRGETAPFRALRWIAKRIISPSPPLLPNFIRPIFRGLYEFHYLVITIQHSLINFFYSHPLFQGRCATFGKNVVIDRLPFVSGHTEIHIGNNVWIGGQVSIMSGRLMDRPLFVMKDHAEIGWNVTITVTKEVIIEEHARVSFGCRISDSDGHPREADLRAANEQVKPRDVRPVRICKHAWIGNGSCIMKGVTIGEGAVIGANSVVINDIPPYTLALGNPAEVLLRNFGRPSKKSAEI